MKLLTHEQAAAVLLGGGVGVLATDTVYGIVARATDVTAVERFYALKQREHKPGTVIAASVNQLLDLGIEERYLRRVANGWPGPLSVETPLDDSLTYLHQGTGRQGFRVVADERVRKVLEITGPLVTSSANQPGEPPANTVQQAIDYFNQSVDFYVDAGDRTGLPPSTIVRITDDGVEVIRYGAAPVPEAGK